MGDAISCCYRIHPHALVSLMLGFITLEMLKNVIIASLSSKARLSPTPLLHLAIRPKSKLYCI